MCIRDRNAATGKEHTSVYSRVLEEYLPRAVEITLSMVRDPLLDPKDIDSERQVVLEEIAMHLDSPDELVHDYLSQVMWGCTLYTSDAADDLLCVDLGGRRIIQKKKK